MQDFINWLLTTEYASYIVILGAFFTFLNHVVANLPPSVTAKIPDWLMTIVNTLATANYNHSANAKTDIAGNPKDDDTDNAGA